jgi:hypothetical protein
MCPGLRTLTHGKKIRPVENLGPIKYCVQMWFVRQRSSVDSVVPNWEVVELLRKRRVLMGDNEGMGAPSLEV